MNRSRADRRRSRGAARRVRARRLRARRGRRDRSRARAPPRPRPRGRPPVERRRVARRHRSHRAAGAACAPTCSTPRVARRRGPADPVVDVYLSLSDRLEQAIVEPARRRARRRHAERAHRPRSRRAHGRAGEPARAEPRHAHDRRPRTRTRSSLARTRCSRASPTATSTTPSALWRDSVEANRAWAVANPDRTAIWRGLGLTRDDTLLVRSFEAWIHTDDLRTRRGAARSRRREPRHLVVDVGPRGPDPAARPGRRRAA